MISPLHRCFAFVVLVLCGSRLGAAPPITALAVSPDGSLLVVGRPRALEWIRPAGKERSGTNPLPLPKITSLAFQHPGQRLWVAGGVPGESGLVLALDLPDFREARRIQVPGDLVQAVVPSPNGRWLAWTDGSDVRLESMVPGTTANPTPSLLRGHSARVLGLAWSPDGCLLTSVASDRSVKVWTTTQESPLRTFNHHTETPHAVAFQPGATIPTCATGGDDRTVRVWQPSIGRMVRIVRNHDAPILALAYAPDGRHLYTADASGTVRRVDAASDQVLGTWAASEDWIHAIGVHPQGQWIATGDARGALRLWTPGGQEIPPSP